MQPVKVKILDREYFVRSRDSADDLQKIAEYVNRVAEEIRDGSEGLNERQTAILTAIHIAGEFFQAQTALNKRDIQETQRIKAMIFDIDSALA